ncbi:MAG: dihydrolipoyl dehydrogenase family protein [Chloroflexota bacterium]
MKKYDLLVIGAGTGGSILDAAFERGESVAVIESNFWGGTCINNGCIPSKMLIQSAEVSETARNGEYFGVRSRVDGVDWSRVVGRVKEKLGPVWDGIEEWYGDESAMDAYHGQARFADEKVVEVNGQPLTADKIVVSAGARPAAPPIPGLNTVPYITSNEALYLDEQPRKLLILGGGYIGAELGHFFAGLGTEVTIVDMLPEMLMIEDHEIRQRFTESFSKRVNLVLNATVQSAGAQDGKVTLTVESEGRSHNLHGDALLLAAGRRPNTDILDVGVSGIETDPAGQIKVNEYMETNVPGVWALGDIVNTPPLKHIANMEGRVVKHNLWHPEDKVAADYHATPHAVFSSPQVASVGMTEEQAENAGLPYKAIKNKYGGTAYGWAIGDDEDFLKLLVNVEDGQILGAHIVGPQASILIQQLVMAMRLNLTVDRIKDVIYIHPAATELVEGAIRQV